MVHKHTVFEFQMLFGTVILQQETVKINNRGRINETRFYNKTSKQEWTSEVRTIETSRQRKKRK